MVQTRYTVEELFNLQKPVALRGQYQSTIAFPLGGIGTGTISLSGRGELVDWEIFNRPNKNSVLPFSFFTLYAKAANGQSVTKIVQAPAEPPFTGQGLHPPFGGIGFGVPRENGAGLPHFQSCTFRGEYPFAYIDFIDDAMPVDVSLEAYNPFIPLNDKDSGIPVAIFRFDLTNKTQDAVNLTLAANLANVIGYPGTGSLYGDFLGKNVNEFRQEDGLSGLCLSSTKYAPNSPKFGTMTLTTPWQDTTHKSYWLRGFWFDNYHNFWDEFSKSGEFTEQVYEPVDTAIHHRPDIGSLGLKATLKPGESVTLPIYITWHFPNFEKYWGASNCSTTQCRPTWKNYYSTLFDDAWSVAQYVDTHHDRLYRETKLFHDSLFQSTLPDYVLDAVSSQASIIRSTTCIRLGDGSFYGFEGCHGNAGCCEGSCTHVWNYAQSLAFLFPKLERSLRDNDYTYNQFEDGKMCFRLQLPLGTGKWDFHAAADGQMGGILKTYRDWKLSGDDEWLRSIWPNVKKALEYAWHAWDKDKDGVMESIQHNTYDIEFYGPNTMMGSFYLGALLAAAEMAEYVGEPDKAKEYRQVMTSGRRKMDEELFNGEYYIQKYDPADAPKYQYGEGCLSDQLIGQWFSHIVGLGYLFDADNVRRTVASVFRYNWRPDFKDHANCQRIYALNDEAGLLLCSWPRGNRPAFPFVYSDEVWCGIEYQVASHLIYEGYIEEGLAIVKGVRDRHDGHRRNPWNEFECGSHYARSLASWSVLTALSGFHFDMPRRQLGFAPRIFRDSFQTFWSVDSGWGVYDQKRNHGQVEVNLSVRYGSLEIASLLLDVLDPREDVQVKVGEKLISATLKKNDANTSAHTLLRLEEPVLLSAGDILNITQS